MAGLVSRWFIERLQGYRVVNHLVMCGTPNNGSPFGHVGAVRNILRALTTVALNFFPATAPFGSAILFVLNRSKKLTSTLEQMSPASDFIAQLNSGVDPSISYTVLAGDIDSFDEESRRPFHKLLAKMGKEVVLETLFGTEHHDIAARVDSIHGIAHASKIPVACHHLNYFASEAGLRALASVSWDS